MNPNHHHPHPAVSAILDESGLHDDDTLTGFLTELRSLAGTTMPPAPTDLRQLAAQPQLAPASGTRRRTRALLTAAGITMAMGFGVGAAAAAATSPDFRTLTTTVIGTVLGHTRPPAPPTRKVPTGQPALRTGDLGSATPAAASADVSPEPTTGPTSAQDATSTVGDGSRRAPGLSTPHTGIPSPTVPRPAATQHGAHSPAAPATSNDQANHAHPSGNAPAAPTADHRPPRP